MVVVDRPELLDARPQARSLSKKQIAVAALTSFGVLLLVVWKTGPGTVPGPEGFEQTARNWPHSQVTDAGAYVLRESLGQALYHLLGWHGTHHFLAFNAAALAVAGTALAVWIVRELGLERGVLAGSLVLVAPITSVLLEWIGIYDSFSVITWVLLLVTLRSRGWVQFAAAVLGGLQNFEQFAVSLVLLMLLPELLRRRRLRAHPVALFAGVVVGKIVLEAYLRYEGAPSGSRESYLTGPGILEGLIHTSAMYAPLIVWSGLGALWLPLLRLLPAHWAGWSRSLRIRTVSAAVIALAIGFASSDHTRVLTLVTFPVVVLLAMGLAEEEEGLTRWLRRPETWAVLFAPPVIVFAGIVLPMGLQLSQWGIPVPW